MVIIPVKLLSGDLFQADRVIGDRKPRMEDLRALKFTTRVINESMRLYPQPPVLIRRALEPDTLGGYNIDSGTDIFISVWNLHRSAAHNAALNTRAH